MKPTTEHIIARLCEELGERLELLHLAKEPYEHYYDDAGEEVPSTAIVKWQEVTI